MPKKSVLPKETIMYSVHKETGDIIVHHLPWERGNPQLEHYERKGFTYERPAEKIVTALAATERAEKNIAAAGKALTDTVPCPGCGKRCKPQGIKAHMRACKKVKA